MYDADGEGLQAGGVFEAVAGPEAAAVVVPTAVEDVIAGLDGPVPAIQREKALGAGGVGGMAGDAVGVLDGLLAGGLDGNGAFEQEGLADIGEVEVIIKCGGGPGGAAFDASVAQQARKHRQTMELGARRIMLEEIRSGNIALIWELEELEARGRLAIDGDDSC